MIDTFFYLLVPCFILVSLLINVKKLRKFRKNMPTNNTQTNETFAFDTIRYTPPVWNTTYTLEGWTIPQPVFNLKSGDWVKCLVDKFDHFAPNVGEKLLTKHHKYKFIRYDLMYGTHVIVLDNYGREYILLAQEVELCESKPVVARLPSFL